MKRLLAIALLLAGAACSSAPKAEKTSGNVAIVAIDAVTFGSKDAKLHQNPLPPATILGVADKLKAAGAKVVIVDLAGADPSETAINAVQQYTGKVIEAGSLPRDEKGQLKVEPASDKTEQIRTDRGTLVQEHVPTFAQMLSFSTAYHAPVEDLRKTVAGKIVYLGCTVCSPADLKQSKAASDYPKLFSDARLADQLLLSDAVTGKKDE